MRLLIYFLIRLWTPPKTEFFSGQYLAWHFCENLLQAKLTGAHDLKHLSAVNPPGDIRIRGTAYTGRHVSPSGWHQGTSGNSRAAWPGPYHSLPQGFPRASADESSWQGVPGGGQPYARGPRTSLQVACFSPPPVHVSLHDPIQAGSLPCPDLGWGEPTAVFVTTFCDKLCNACSQPPCQPWHRDQGPTQLRMAPPAG